MIAAQHLTKESRAMARFHPFRFGAAAWLALALVGAGCGGQGFVDENGEWVEEAGAGDEQALVGSDRATSGGTATVERLSDRDRAQATAAGVAPTTVPTASVSLNQPPPSGLLVNGGSSPDPIPARPAAKGDSAATLCDVFPDPASRDSCRQAVGIRPPPR